MNLKKFEFTSKDAPFIKRDITLRLVFTALFVALFVWQFVALVIAQSTNSISTAKLVATIFVLLTSLLMAMLGFVYAFKDIRILNAVKKRGSCVSTVDIIFSTKKHSFVRLYQIICQVLALVCLFVLLCSLTYAVLQLAYFSTISYYMPILMLVCTTGFNSVFHVHSEIKTVETVKQYHSYY